MAKINKVTLYGRVQKEPVISKDRSTGEYQFGFCYIDTVRSLRDAGDKVHFVKHSKPMVLTREKDMLDMMSTWKENDIVEIKGVIHSKSLPKTSYCSECKAKNEVLGNLVTVSPIHMMKIKSYGDDKQAAIEDVVQNREVSNQILIYGTLLRDPKKFVTKHGLQITQYPIASNREYTVRTDDPTIRTDYPIVKSYGEQAIDDRAFLKFQSEIVIDGFLQARNVKRKKVCEKCGKIYEWTDTCMEIVPYTVEHINGCRTKEDIENEQRKTLEAYKQELFSNAKADVLEDDLKSDDIT